MASRDLTDVFRLASFLALLLFLYAMSLQSLQGRDMDWFSSLAKNDDDGVTILFAIFASPAYLILAGLREFSRRLLGMMQNSYLREFEYSVDFMYRYVSIVPEFFALGPYSVLWAAEQSFAKAGSRLHGLLRELADFDKVSLVVGALCYLSFEFGYVGFFSRLLLLAALLLFGASVLLQVHPGSSPFSPVYESWARGWLPRAGTWALTLKTGEKSGEKASRLDEDDLKSQSIVLEYAGMHLRRKSEEVAASKSVKK